MRSPEHWEAVLSAIANDERAPAGERAAARAALAAQRAKTAPTEPPKARPRPPLPPGVRPKVMLVFHDRRWHLLLDDEVVWSGPGEVEIVVQPTRFDFMRENFGDLHGSYIHRSGPTEVRIAATWFIDPRSSGYLLLHDTLSPQFESPELAVMVGAEVEREPVAWLFKRALIEQYTDAPEHGRRYRSAPVDGPEHRRQTFTIWAQDPSTVFAETSVRVAMAALPPARKILPP